MNGLDPLVTSGLQLMLVGMGTVFVFLSLLVFAVRAMSEILGRLTPEQQASVSRDTAGGVPPAHVAAIAGALEEHTKR